MTETPGTPTVPETTAPAALPQVAFIGLGHMGAPMAANLVAAGYRVRGFDLVPEALETARAAGVEIAGSGPEAVQGAALVITMLPAGRHVLVAYQGTPGDGEALAVPGLLEAAAPDTLFMDCSTISVEDARRAHELATAAGHRSLDAPVSGGVVGAEAGTLTMMVGGSAEDYAEALPVLEVVGRRIVHCGDAGAGQAAKVCNNLILGASMIAVSEAFVLGERLGLSNQALFDVASTASGQCWALTTNCPVPGPVPTSPANRDYRPGFAGALMAKDLGLARHAIEATGTESRIGLLAERIYAAFAAGEGADRDFSAIIEQIREHSALETEAGTGTASGADAGTDTGTGTGTGTGAEQ
ncbi:3-hydroxyisobutyrate dehydrogenase [Citricoccus sp. SGAir0253]|uniref:3-hydroxyisobutyrate dehydrogenase n=1 Tax=Citricoccus sp. SGAir0253 TaxID=2567881 RepID=UPI0010CCB323|nr:3-hydroxyisobutyrate dehydrogenase [Citricoccus sp. SGAir0253]QCU78992.1 3-hydroxyisobutyrate dehydrogenase [Citricoccus sp. SGAir0253]